MSTSWAWTSGRRRRDAHDRSYLYENDAPAEPKKKKRMRFFGKDEETDAGLEGYVGDEAFEHAIVDDDETTAAPTAPRQAAGFPPARRAAPHPGRDRRREDQGRPRPGRQGRGFQRENPTEAIPLVTPGMVAAGSLNAGAGTAAAGAAAAAGTRLRQVPHAPCSRAAAHADPAAHGAAVPGRRCHLHPAGVGRT